MKCLTVPNPWAACVVFGATTFINMKYSTKLSETVLIRSDPHWDSRAWEMQGQLNEVFDRAYNLNVHGSILGCVEIHGWDHVEDVQLVGATGPIIWHARGHQVALKPLLIETTSQLCDVPDSLADGLKLVQPVDAVKHYSCESFETRVDDPNAVYPPRAAGEYWRGD